MRLSQALILMLMWIATSVVAQDEAKVEKEWPVLSGEYLGQPPPGSQPVLFAEGIIPVDGIQHCFPAFSPDGKEVYWMTVAFENDKPRGEIWFTHEVDGRWTKPAIASFSGEYNDHAPVFSPDGLRLYFASSRPGGVGTRKNIWFVERDGAGWSEPRHLGSPPNTDVGVSQSTFTSDGTVYFVGAFEGTTWNTAIYRSRLVDGQYQQPELLGEPIRTTHADTYPFIAHDESYLLFGSSRPGANSVETDLYICFRNADDSWGEPTHMDQSINNGKSVSFSFVTYDGKYLFFDRFDEDGTDKFFWVDAAVIEKYRALHNGENR
ncbi:MAG: PD40 domain-containing protein [Candidatus Zixiibacteriota bacterium]|nr:MAG: PD40 domain-containing protein [candidate division Zixibacteria bacterium]